MTSTHKLVSRPAFIAAGLAMTLFSALNAAEANTEKVLYSFGGTPDGDNPTGGLVMDERGNFCGTTVNGGAHGFGTIYKMNRGREDHSRQPTAGQ